MDELKFLGFSVGIQVLAIFGILIVALPTIFLMDRIWPSRPYVVRNWEHMVAIFLVTGVIVVVA